MGARRGFVDMVSQILVSGPPTRRFPKRGDVIAMQLVQGGFVHVAVASTAIAFWGPDFRSKFNLLYVHNEIRAEPTPPPKIRRNALIVPPLVTNRQGWLKGFFQKVGEDRDLEVWPSHCFFQDRFDGEWIDELGQQLPAPSGDVGWAQLFGYNMIGLVVSHAFAGTQSWPWGSPRPGTKQIPHRLRPR